LDIDWNTKCFEQLVLPDHQKELVQALVSEHTQRATNFKAGFDDIVMGKGQGLILVLHGPPGVCKTLTAECVAEFSRRSLYIVSSGDLGTDSSELDKRLTRTLDLASTWKAVLLIDEADVFLERRSLHDVERNTLVSIFLRTLEYYSGILFMTTNRVATFDDAFKSRIHVPLKYGDLPACSRVKVWKNFLEKIEGGIKIDDKGYEKLAEGKLNGRQIKNVVRTAKSLAAYKKRKLDIAQLEQVMRIQMTFEDELSGVGEDRLDLVGCLKAS
jgi:SpoVK/Ycf46/Vps4 family AAA+-type ATPase